MSAHKNQLPGPKVDQLTLYECAANLVNSSGPCPLYSTIVTIVTILVKLANFLVAKISFGLKPLKLRNGRKFPIFEDIFQTNGSGEMFVWADLSTILANVVVLSPIPTWAAISTA